MMNPTKVRFVKDSDNKVPVFNAVLPGSHHVEGSAADWTEMRSIPIGCLDVDPKYQRLLKRGWVQDIVDNYKPDLVQVLHVSFRDGKYWIIDGQHTKEAILIKFSDPNFPVICKVYYGLTREEESELFYLLNKNKKQINSADSLKAQVFYGEEESKSFFQHTSDEGFIIQPEKCVKSKFSILAFRKAQNCFRALGPEKYDRMLRLLRDTWGGERWSLTAKMLGGMASLLATYGDKLDDRVFVKQLSCVTEMEIKMEVRRFFIEKTNVAYASAMVNFYNKGRRKGKLRQAQLVSDDDSD